MYLGIGVAWLLAACVHSARGTVFRVDTGNFQFMYMIFFISAFILFGVLLLRRFVRVRGTSGELGGWAPTRWASALLLGAIWVLYIVLSALNVYCII